ncbi:MAG TPA: hypothetical protein VG317_04145 [Pseudonocardiaceae bacterium]|jgi:hypothetical protein|nr:hypothetical protein [Pseudonocardiaceae bacterium]
MSPITFRPDTEAERALRELTSDGRSVSAAIRDALLTAARSHEQERLRAESLSLADDSDDLAEARAVLADMESFRAW